MANNQSLVVRLCAPTQSWGGETNYWEDRTTQASPTLSGVIGMLGNAAGLDRDNDAGQLRDLGRARMWVRLDSPGRRRPDLQTIAGTINTKGDRKPHSIMSDRWFIANGCFTVFLSWPDDPDTATRMMRALQHPARPLHLGRHCHPLPARPHLHRYSEPVTDTLIAAHPHCDIHPPSQETWAVHGPTDRPLYERGIQTVSDRPIGLRQWAPRVVTQWKIPVIEPITLETGKSSYTLDASMRVVTSDEVGEDA